MRAALDGDPVAAQELYRLAASQIDGLGLSGQAEGVRVLSRVSLLIMQDQAAGIVGELDRYPGLPASLPELYALGIAVGGRVVEARAAAGRPLPIRPDRIWLFHTAIRALLGIAIDDRDRATSAYQSMLPFAGRLTGADSMLVTLWPVAQILGDLARYLGLPDAQTHYRQALGVAERAHAQPWREAAIQRLRERQQLTPAPARGLAASSPQVCG